MNLKKMKKNNKKKLIYCFLGLFIIISISISIFLLSDSYALFSLSKEVDGKITVPENNYCLNHGFDRLSDCILIMENYSTTMEDAKSYITSKGEGKFDQIAPTITYRETTSEMNNNNGIITTTNHFTLGTGYTFNSSTGLFTLTNYTNDDLTDKYIGYYTCGGSTSTYASCTDMYQIKNYIVTTDSNGTTTYRITSAIKHTYRAVDALDSEIGLYKTKDDVGETYYYRGNVKNNYVSFAGYIWRIVRVNGNGSVRLIYSGTSTSDTGSKTTIGTSAFNDNEQDPTYVGYMYSENKDLNIDQNLSSNYNSFSENAKYYFSNAYTFDEQSETFKLSGETIYGTWTEVHEDAIANYPYTCFGTSATGSCTVLKKVIHYTNPYTAVVNLLSYSSTSYEETLQNTTDSTIKKVLDTWYQNNLLNKKDSNNNSFADYLSDEIFCNDRTINTGTGYLLSPITTYGPYQRLITMNAPTLQCSQKSDQFTVSELNGNGKLTYPIGLLTADEVAAAGGRYSSVNTQFYLYTGNAYWTLSPYSFSPSTTNAYISHISATGYLSAAGVSTDTLGVRPVINLSKDVKISGGDGTSSNPYIIDNIK